MQLSIPIFASSGFVIVSGLLDTAVMGWASVKGLAGVAAGAALISVLYGIPATVAIAHQIGAARAFGANAPANVGRSLRHALALAGALALIMAIVIVIAGDAIIGLVTGGGAAAQAGAVFAKVRGIEFLVDAPIALITATYSTKKDTRTGMYAFGIANAVNVLLDVVLVLVARMDALGNALANLLGAAAALGYLLIRLHRSGLLQEISFWDSSWNGAEWASLVRLGTPLAISNGLDYLGVFALFVIVGQSSVSQLAGARLDYAVLIMMYGLFRALQVGSQILMGRAFGAQDLIRLRKLWISATALLAAVGLPIGLGLWLAHRLVLSAMTNLPGLVDAATPGLILIGASLPIMGVALANVAVLRATGRPKFDLYANLTAIWLIQIPLVVVLTVDLGWGLTGMFVGFAVYWLVRAALAGAFWLRLQSEMARQ